MADKGGIVAVNGGRGVIQRRQQIFLDSADIGGIFPHPVKDVLNVGAVQLQKPGLYHLGGVIVPGNADHLPLGADGIHHKLHQLVQTIPVKPVILRERIILDVLQNELTIAFTLSHLVLSDPLPGGRGT